MSSNGSVMETEFRPWFTDHGGTIHPDVEIASDASGNCFRLKTGCSLLPGTTIASCPHSLTISWLNVTLGQTPFIKQFSLCPVQNGSTLITKTVVVRFFIVQQYLLGEQSYWWQYLRSIPQPVVKGEVNSLLWYDDEDMTWLRGTNMEDAMARVERDRRREYDEALGTLSDPTGVLKKAWSW